MAANTLTITARVLTVDVMTMVVEHLVPCLEDNNYYHYNNTNHYYNYCNNNYNCKCSAWGVSGFWNTL